MTGGSGEVGVELGFAGGFIAAEAHGDDGDAGEVSRVINGGEKVCGTGVVGFDEDDVGAGGEGVGPFDVEGFFTLEVVVAGAGGIDGGEVGGAAGLADD